MGGVTSDLVSKSLGLDNTDIIDDSLVDMEIVGQSDKTRQIRRLEINLGIIERFNAESELSMDDR